MKIINLSKTFVSSNNSSITLFNNLNLEIPEKKVTCIMGTSGSGKTTLLNIVAGLIEPDCGSVEKSSLRVSYLFQEPRLLGWKTVLDNVALVSDIETAKKYLDMVGLKANYSSFPDELSGGQRQRVAIARALAFDAPILLMDEPFQNLDEKLKEELTNSMISFCSKTEKTVLWVTHDSEEAGRISDSIINL